MKILIITNGDNAADRIKELDVADTVLPWRDVLHDGPVPGGLNPTELAKKRIQFLAEFADVSASDIEKDFAAREDILSSVCDFDRVELWFEHDLYDQLQLIEVIDRLYDFANLFVVQVDHYLSELAEDIFASLSEKAVLLDPQARTFARKVWYAFRQPNHEDLKQLSNEKSSILPFVASAIKRVLAEHPDVETGLPQSMKIALSPLLNKEHSLKDLFLLMQEREEAKFMGDLSFSRMMDEFIDCPSALLQSTKEGLLKTSRQADLRDYFGQCVILTNVGRRVLEGHENHIAINGIDRWLGGVHFYKKVDA
ncbi:MAG: DUF1835 domain-containing protein [Methylocystaceae bacterium]|nr:DUF1835 domain-containing protein [Methylocystaceae bacterium]